ncbi:MAG: cache domain-containing protein [Methanoregula sp.]|nr:cache domain-containing protein [Methanoregula sp.]
MMTRSLCLTIALLLVFLIAVTGCTQGTGSAVAAPSGTLSVTPSPAMPQDLTTNETLVAFVKEAVAYADANGKDAALAEFNRPNGSFVRGELYIYAYDFNGTTIAHPFNPEKIGVNRINETDAHGNYFIKDLRDAAENGSGFVEFYYINPAHNRTVEKKLGYVEKAGDSWWLGSGMYEGPA